MAVLPERLKRLRGRRRWLLRGLAAVVVLSLVATGVTLSATYKPPELQPGTIESPADGNTVISVQGYHFEGEGNRKKPSRIVSVGPRGTFQWKYDGSTGPDSPNKVESWFYDVDPLPNGNLLMVNAQAGHTLVYAVDPSSQKRVWTEKLDIIDTHDVTMLPNGNIMVANLHNTYNSTSNERLFEYNRTTDEVVWQWNFSDHYPPYTDEGVGTNDNDWTHVNDVDVVNETHLLASPRNFDQVIMINRTSKEIVMRLGADGNYDVLSEQHNPTFLRGPNGEPTILVADSENDRVVEYACTEWTDGTCEWDLVWEVGAGQFNWPRDADRLPNGNTLITDSLNQRVIEVTPTGDIVWEYYAPWAPYDAERPAYGEEAGGPTMREQGVSGSYQVSGSAGLVPGTAGRVTFATWLMDTAHGTPVDDQVTWFAKGWRHVAPWVRPVWMSPWSFLAFVLAGVALVGWGGAELVFQRHRLVRGGRRAVERVTR